MDFIKEVDQQIGLPESSHLEYKAVLPPSKNIAIEIAALANSEGGFIILGISDKGELVGLTPDQPANSITHKALELLSPQPNVIYQFVHSAGVRLYAIRVNKSSEVVYLEGKIFKRDGPRTFLENPPITSFRSNGYKRLAILNISLEGFKKNATNAKVKVIEHYQSVLKIFDDLGGILYPQGPNITTNNAEGQILTRILYSSYVDNFETYLSDLLYEIFLAIPASLKSQQTVTIEEVLNCSDMQEFIRYWAKEKLAKLQRGSVKGFIEDTDQIRSLKVIEKKEIKEMEDTLQIRHLYAHRNGVVDEKFIRYVGGQFQLNQVHTMAMEEICNRMEYLIEIINKLDSASIKKYRLAISN
ncbi:putative DNA-binding protein [Chitinophaga dinghuensis]|uniref:Putative DNA-binding protein n=1 Tax=Chitinophaga dinghuensis TaxID=1539050 RepID=A0A327W528_9BACT|nr:ATP-binding protein [Chitinophaga dinghuensis]RAJ80088.1 putative DNA-binding protein [Chitinophaga dinghuensis]